MMLPRLSVAANFFETMGIPILQGRGLNRQDIEPLISAMASIQSSGGKPPKDFAAPRQVAVINQAMARKYFHGVDPIGRRISFSGHCKDGEIEIVGVARDAKYGGLKQEIRPTAYVPYVGLYFGAPSELSFAVRTAGDPAAMTKAIQKAAQAVEPRMPLYAIKTQEAQIAELVTQERLFASLSSFFGLLALVLVAIGLYGVMSYTVARRTHEIGIRMALGANRRDVLKMILRHGMTLTLLGVTLGLASAYALTKFLENRLDLKSMLYGVQVNDPLNYGVVAVPLTLVALVACWIPARRATRVDPMIALRSE